MPAVTQVILYDDKAWPERVEAQEVVRLTVHWQETGAGPARGREDVELYLTAAGRVELVGDLKKWLALGHRPGTGGKAPAARWAGGSRDASLKHKEGVRDFADAFGLKSRKDPSRAAYETPTGGWSYPLWLLEAYDRWTAAGRPAPGGDWAPEKAA
jgi:hypothetical protein